MQKAISAILFLLLLKVSFSQPSASDFTKLKWLKGTWIRKNADPNTSGTERWLKLSATEWQGFGVTMKGSDTSFIEKLKIITDKNQIWYVADVPENKAPVRFRFTSITEKSFSCENPAHDFPTKISYALNGETLKAVISGHGKSVEYLFEKEME